MKKPTEKDLYFVAVKIFLRDQRGRLLIIKDKFGDWDLPGGRLRYNDFKTPLLSVVKRKLTEELGSGARCAVMPDPVIFMRHERNEVLPGGRRERRRIFALGYTANFLGGEIKLGKNHIMCRWVALKNFRPEKFFSGGWLTGVRQYLRWARRTT